MVRTEKRCSSEPDMGMTTAMVNKKPLVNHWAVRAAMSRSTISTGNATLMIVSLRIMTKAENTSNAMITAALGGAFGCASVRTMGPVLKSNSLDYRTRDAVRPSRVGAQASVGKSIIRPLR